MIKMIKSIIAFMFIVGIFSYIYKSPVCLYGALAKIEHGGLTGSDKVKRFIPIYNIVASEKLYTGSTSLIGVSLAFLAISSVGRILVYNFALENMMLQYVTIILFVLSLLATYIFNVVLSFRILHDADCISIVKTILLSLLFPVGFDYIAKYLPAKVKESTKEDGVF